MIYRRTACAGLVLAALIGLTSCDAGGPGDAGGAGDASGAGGPGGAGDASGPGSAGPSAVTTRPSGAAAPTALESDARAALTAAAAQLAGDSARVHVGVASQLSMTGVVDPRSSQVLMRLDLGQVDDSTKAEVRQIGPQVWIRLQGSLGRLLGANEQWVHVAAADLPATSNFKVLTDDDPAGVRAMVAAATEVRQVGPTSFAGVLDLTRTSRYSAQTLAALGSKASAVPFTALVDRQGRLIKLSVRLSSIVSGAGTATTTFTDFGVAVKVERPPAGEIREMPGDLKSVIDG